MAEGADTYKLSGYGDAPADITLMNMNHEP